MLRHFTKIQKNVQFIHVRATLKGGEKFFSPPPAEIFGIYPPLPRVSPGGNFTPPKKFLDHYRGVEKFYPPLNGQKIQFIPPKMAKKSIYTPQNEPKKFYPTLNLFLEISPPSPGRNFYPPLLATCSHMYALRSNTFYLFLHFGTA